MPQLKQMMVLKDEIAFDSCLIKTSKKDSTKQNSDKQETTREKESSLDMISVITENNIQDDKINNETSELLNEGIEKELGEFTLIKEHLENDDSSNKTQNVIETQPISMNDFDIEEISIENLEDEPDELKEVELNVDDNLDNSITLKKPNQVYFELYKKARDKAKMAKKAAIIAYLEAKNIKKTYMIENIDSSDNEFDQEIEEVSESELDDF